MGGSSISWTICRSYELRSRQITTSAHHHSIFTGRMLFLAPNQQCQSTEGKVIGIILFRQLQCYYTINTVHGQHIDMPTCRCANSPTQVNSPTGKLAYSKNRSKLSWVSTLCAARDGEWEWHQLGQMQIYALPQTHNHTSTPPLSFFYRPDALPAAQPTASKHWRQHMWEGHTQTFI